MTPNERVHAALKAEKVDRPPFIFWHHFKPEGSGERLAELTLDFFIKKFNLDIIKIMPDLPYPMPGIPYSGPDQISNLPRLDLNTPMFREQLICIKKIRSEVGEDYPLILTQFSPLTHLIRYIGRKKAIIEIRQNPKPYQKAMDTIAANLRLIMEAAIEAGANGIFFSSMGATSSQFTRHEYEIYGTSYDLQALEGTRKGWLNIIHIHADPDRQDDQLYFDMFANYPVSAVSWSDKVTGPTLSEARKLTGKCLMAGLYERGPLTHGDEKALEDEMQNAITQTGGKHFILANGCSIPNDTPENWLIYARKHIETLKLLI